MKDVQAGVVLVTKFVSAGNKKFQGYIDYIDRDKAVRNETFTEYSISELQDELNKFENYMDYMGNPQKTSELFTEKKDRLTADEKAKLKNVYEMAQNNGSLMWQTVISFDNRWLAEQGLFNLQTRTVNEAKLKECARGAMSRIIENENLAASTIWSGAIHYNTQHIHIHLAMVEAFPTREIIKDGEYAGQRKGKFKKSTLEKGKSFVVNNILSQKEANQNINDIIRNSLVAAMKDNKILQDKELRNLYLQIYNQLPKNKRLWQYNRNVINPIRDDLDNFITEWIEKNHKEDFEKLKTELQKQQAIYQTAYGERKDEDKSNYAENKIKELYSRLGNAVLANLKTLEITDDLDIPIISGDLDNIEVPETLTDQDIDYNLTEHAAIIFDPAPTQTTTMRSKEYNKAKSLMYQQDPDFRSAFDILSTEAANGNIYAAYDLAYLLSKGLGCDANFERANQLYSFALHGFKEELAKTINNPKVKEKKREFQISYLNYRIAKMYYYGLGAAVNKEVAYQHFTASGSMFSKYYIARYYEQGEIVEKDVTTAFNIYKDIADTVLQPDCKFSMPYAIYKVGHMLENGKGVDKNTVEAQSYYKAALDLFLVSNINSPDDQLQFRIGKMYYDGKGAESDIEKAKKFFISSATLGNDLANYTLAMIYLKDKETPPELIAKAFEMLESSADPEKANNALAQYQLGSILLKNSDNEKGIYYLTLSANQNNEYAQYKLGVYFLESDTVEDKAKGLAFLTESANQGNQFAQYKLGVYFLESDTVEDKAKGLAFLTESANQGNQFAQYKLGVYYINQKEKNESDIFNGLKYLKAAAESNNCFAAYQLGKIYLAGEDVTQDCYQAEKYLLDALKNRSQELDSFSNIEHQLGKLYFNGSEMFQSDIEKGLHYYTVAAEKGNKYSQYALGSIYYYGVNGVERNLELSRHYLTQSAEQGNNRASLLLEKLNNPYQPKQYIKPLYLNLNISENLSSLFRTLGREYKSYENYINQQIYEEMQHEIESET